MTQIATFKGHQWTIVNIVSPEKIDQRIPQRNALIKLMEVEGLKLVVLERQAVLDAMIVRVRKPIQQLAFIEEKTGRLRDLEEFELLRLDNH